eukprot:9468666-Pyramimonas_sp.AAC.2
MIVRYAELLAGLFDDGLNVLVVKLRDAGQQMVHHLVVEAARKIEGEQGPMPVILGRACLHHRPVLCGVPRHGVYVLELSLLRHVIRLEGNGEHVPKGHAQQPRQHQLPKEEEGLAAPEGGLILKAEGSHADVVPLLFRNEGEILDPVKNGQRGVYYRAPDELVSVEPLPLLVTAQAERERPHVGVHIKGVTILMMA